MLDGSRQESREYIKLEVRVNGFINFSPVVYNIFPQNGIPF